MQFSSGFDKEYADKKMMEMLHDLPADIRRKFKYDDEATWSFTHLRIGYDLARFLSRLPGISPKSTITDATASVGGNVIAFSKYFDHINAIELNPDRKTMLDFNCRLLGIDKKVTTYQGYAQDYIYTLKQDIIFFDPPWGTDYKKKANMRIVIGSPTGSQTFESLIKSTAGHTKYCMVKLPNNYDIDHLKKEVASVYELIHIEWHGRPNSMAIVVFGPLKRT